MLGCGGNVQLHSRFGHFFIQFSPFFGFQDLIFGIILVDYASPKSG